MIYQVYLKIMFVHWLFTEQRKRKKKDKEKH